LGFGGRELSRRELGGRELGGRDGGWETSIEGYTFTVRGLYQIL